MSCSCEKSWPGPPPENKSPPASRRRVWAPTFQYQCGDIRLFSAESGVHHDGPGIFTNRRRDSPGGRQVRGKNDRGACTLIQRGQGSAINRASGPVQEQFRVCAIGLPEPAELVKVRAPKRKNRPGADILPDSNGRRPGRPPPSVAAAMQSGRI